MPGTTGNHREATLADIQDTEPREGRPEQASSDRRERSNRSSRDTRPPRREWRGRDRQRRGKKVCTFCVEEIEEIDYKDISVLSRYVNERGRITPRRRTGTCAKHQRRLSKAIKRARHLALMPFAPQHVRAVE